MAATPMKYALASYRGHDGGSRRAALVIDEVLYDLVDAFGADAPSWACGSLDDVVARWDEAGAVLESLSAPASQPISGKLDAPLRPTRIFAAASNYVEHADEMGTVLAAKKDSNPYMFTKMSSTVVGPGDTVRIPPESKKVDWEVELGVVIGKRGRRIPLEQTLDYVAGYTIVNDVSARDLTRRDDYPFKFDWFQGKNFDTFMPLGPWIVPRSAIDDPQRLHLRLDVNGETMQDASTGAMIFDVREQIAYLSSLLTLEPGDVIATGTPTGVGMGRGVFLKPGDVMTASIEGIGVLENPVEAEEVGS